MPGLRGREGVPERVPAAEREENRADDASTRRWGSAVAEGTEVGVFGRNPDNELWYRETTSGTFGAWTKLSTSTNVASRPKAVMAGSDLYVFFRSTGNDLRYFKRTGGTWGTEQNLGGVIAASPAAAVDGDGDLIVAARTSAGVVFFNRLPSGGKLDQLHLAGRHHPRPARACRLRRQRAPVRR